MPPSKRPAPTPPTKKKCFDFSSTPSKKTKSDDPNKIPQFMIKTEDAERAIWYARVGIGRAADLQTRLNQEFEAGLGGAIIYRVDVSNKGDCLSCAIFARKAVDELGAALQQLLPAGLTLDALDNAHLIPKAPTLEIITTNDYVKAGAGWHRLKKWLLNDRFLGGHAEDDGSGVIFNKDETNDEEYWVNSLQAICEAKGFDHSITEQCSSLAPAPSRRAVIWALHPNIHPTHDREPSFIITADEKAELLEWNHEQSRYQSYMQIDHVEAASDSDSEMSDCSTHTIPVLHETQSRGMHHSHAMMHHSWQHDAVLDSRVHVGWMQYLRKYINK